MNNPIIVHSKPFIPDGTLDLLDDVLKSGMLAQGEFTRRFESFFARWVGAKDGFALSAGAAAIYLALKTLDIKTEDEVILPTYVCRSVLDAVLACNATPVLCDVGVNWVLVPANVEQYISEKTKAIIVPHMYGIFADIDSFKKLHIPIIEDCAQAVGHKGSFQIKGDIAVFSFHPTKCITTGEGGMLLSNNESLIEKIRLLRDGPKGRQSFSPLSDINSAIGIMQMRNYSEFLCKREQIAKGYMEISKRLIPDSLRDIVLNRSMFFRFPLYIKGRYEECKTLFATYQINVRNGVDLLLHRTLGETDDEYPNAADLINSTVLIPIYPALTENEYERIVNAMNNIFAGMVK